MISISFIIPYYNTPKYINETILSIDKLNVDHEIIVVNDNVGVEMNLENKNVKVINNVENIGSGGSRNNGILSISKKSTHIFFIDSDDLIYSSEFISEIRKNPGAIIDFKYCDFYTNKLIPSKSNGIEGKYKNQIWGMAIPVEKLVKEFFWVEGENNDSAIKRRIIKKHEILDSEVIAIKYRIRKSSVIHSRFSEKRAEQEVQTIINLINEGVFDEKAWNDAYFELFIHKSSFSEVKYKEMMKTVLDHNITRLTKVNAFFYRLTNFWQTKNMLKSFFLNRKMFE